MNVVEVTQLRVDYDDVTAVNDVSFHLEKGKIYGFVGPNGAGKTSTIKALAGILEPKRGTILLNGFNLETQREKALAHIGYMPDFSPVYENLKVWEYLDVFAAAYGLKAGDRSVSIEKWLQKVDLTIKRDTLIKGLSRGMRQRLVLAKILETDPKILFLDEPASGLDPIARKQIRDLLKEVSTNGVTILISSHILSELSDFVDSVIILEKGNLIMAGGIEDIRKQTGGAQKLMVRFTKEEEGLPVFEKILSSEGVSQEQISQDKSKYIVHLQSDDGTAFRLLNKLITSNVLLEECSVKKEDIEDIFLKVGAKEVS
ncbi:MAG: ABC transporter ATP-binding protein [Candidatus Omnitrophica bacterium]|nr:ABC transporter ATP-binding protein [Candidatus Omnitrophota bacterium]